MPLTSWLIHVAQVRDRLTQLQQSVMRYRWRREHELGLTDLYAQVLKQSPYA